MPRSTPPKALVLFDIDGTLLRSAGPHHREAIVKAIGRVLGLKTTMEGVAIAGMLDRDIVTSMLVREGLSSAEIRRSMPAIVVEAQRVYKRTCPDLRGKVCPGARMLLYKLARRGISTSLVTGNLSAIGWRKMERAGLRPHLRFGAFAEMAKDRAGLVKIAIRHARQQGWIDKASPIALLGDHFNDIRAAQANGVRSIAVATGHLTTDELASHAPDVLVADMRGLTIETVLGRRV